MSATDDVRPADAAAVTWVDRYAPPGVRPYLRLARADRPIGIWLLLWPCWWSLLLAAPETGFAYPSVWYIPLLAVLFALGAAVMRGAGCTYNDIVDRDIDAKVARTAGRPIPSGQVSVVAAVAFLIAQLLLGLLVLLQLNWFSVVLGALSLVPIAIYPFMKRITNWPQAFLGLTFNWGALLGWAAVTGGLGLAPVLLFAGCVFWTLGYDTIYAHQDKEDDALIGVRSTARLLGDSTKAWLAGFYGAALLLFLAAGLLAGTGFGFFVVLGAVAAHFTWQILRLDINDGANCLATFKSNRDLGLIVFAAIVAGIITG
ncbi:MAG: 4-hydroxybenzoate octaprenyltransferase [Alphaproteobacteria bacterium]|nr:4-hydroxybenzoate octaprenyltransferase [Alphaproteobacteria bacterium]